MAACWSAPRCQTAGRLATATLPAGNSSKEQRDATQSGRTAAVSAGDHGGAAERSGYYRRMVDSPGGTGRRGREIRGSAGYADAAEIALQGSLRQAPGSRARGGGQRRAPRQPRNTVHSLWHAADDVRDL